jgi:hypothetical protein
MRFAVLILLFFAVSGCNNHTKPADIPEHDWNQAMTAFDELNAVLKKEKGQTWGFSLEGPVMLVNRETRTIIANEQDDAGVLVKSGPMYVGKLTDNVNIANTAFDWNGQRWTMVALPLPEVKVERLSLLVHESFHRIQPEIGFDSLNDVLSSHLDTKEGRIYLKLELEALKEALSSDEPESHLKNALLFRKYRHRIFPEAKNLENSLEINEGLAEYTGSILSQRSDSDLKKHYVSNVDLFYTFPTFVRSFPYFTVPVYGYFMRQNDNQWNLRVTKETNLTEFFTGFFDPVPPDPGVEYILQLGKSYGVDAIFAGETEREMEKERLKNRYKSIFLADSVLDIGLKNMGISFNPRDIVPLDSFGSVYPMLRLTDDWGILEVDSGGVLLSPGWDRVTLSSPLSVSDSLILGRGWKLILLDGWNVEKSGVRYRLNREDPTKQ